jgi:hypothetical protein
LAENRRPIRSSLLLRNDVRFAHDRLADVFCRGHPNQEITWRDLVFYKQFDSRTPRVFLL